MEDDLDTAINRRNLWKSVPGVDHIEEMLHHGEWAALKSENFVGREKLVAELLDAISLSDMFLTQSKFLTCAVIGSSGCGKTALMAKVAQLAYLREVSIGTADEPASSGHSNRRRFHLSPNVIPSNMAASTMNLLLPPQSSIIGLAPVQPRPVIIRFCGTSPDSSDAFSLIRSICLQLSLVFCQPNDWHFATSVTDYIAAVQHFHHLLQVHPIILFIDSLDQLSDAYQGRSRLSFLSNIQPHPDTRIIVSTLPDELDPVTREWIYCYQCESRLREWQIPILEVGKLGIEIAPIRREEAMRRARSDASHSESVLFADIPHIQDDDGDGDGPAWDSDEYENMLAIILREKYRRQCSAQQTMYVLRQAAEEPSVLYLQLACRIISNWTSSDVGVELASGVTALIHQIFGGLEAEYGVVVTRAALGFLTFARSGVTDNEMQNLLTLHQGVIEEVDAFHTMRRPRLPFHVWARLRSALEGLIVEKQDGCLRWYHRQLQETAERRYSIADTNSRYHFNFFTEPPATVPERVSANRERLELHFTMARFFGNAVGQEERELKLIAEQPLLWQHAADRPKTGHLVTFLQDLRSLRAEIDPFKQIATNVRIRLDQYIRWIRMHIGVLVKNPETQIPYTLSEMAEEYTELGVDYEQLLHQRNSLAQTTNVAGTNTVDSGIIPEMKTDAFPTEANALRTVTNGHGKQWVFPVIWKVERSATTARPEMTLSGCKAHIMAITASPTAPQVAISYQSGMIEIWDVEVDDFGATTVVVDEDDDMSTVTINGIYIDRWKKPKRQHEITVQGTCISLTYSVTPRDRILVTLENDQIVCRDGDSCETVASVTAVRQVNLLCGGVLNGAYVTTTDDGQQIHVWSPDIHLDFDDRFRTPGRVPPFTRSLSRTWSSISAFQSSALLPRTHSSFRLQQQRTLTHRKASSERMTRLASDKSLPRLSSERLMMLSRMPSEKSLPRLSSERSLHRYGSLIGSFYRNGGGGAAGMGDLTALDTFTIPEVRDKDGGSLEYISSSDDEDDGFPTSPAVDAPASNGSRTGSDGGTVGVSLATTPAAIVNRSRSLRNLKSSPSLHKLSFFSKQQAHNRSQLLQSSRETSGNTYGIDTVISDLAGDFSSSNASLMDPHESPSAVHVDGATEDDEAAIQETDDRIDALCVHPDGKYVAVARHRDNHITLWSLDGRLLIDVLPDHLNATSADVLTPAMVDDLMEIARTSDLLRVIYLRFLRQGQRLLIGLHCGLFVIWDVSERRFVCAQRFREMCNPRFIVVSPDDRHLVPNFYAIWDMETGAIVHRPPSSLEYKVSVFSSAGDQALLICAKETGSLIVYDARQELVLLDLTPADMTPELATSEAEETAAGSLDGTEVSKATSTEVVLETVPALAALEAAVMLQPTLAGSRRRFNIPPIHINPTEAHETTMDTSTMSVPPPQRRHRSDRVVTTIDIFDHFGVREIVHAAFAPHGSTVALLSNMKDICRISMFSGSSGNSSDDEPRAVAPRLLARVPLLSRGELRAVSLSSNLELFYCATTGQAARIFGLDVLGLVITSSRGDHRHEQEREFLRQRGDLLSFFR
eukprot:gene8935-6417_t